MPKASSMAVSMRVAKWEPLSVHMVLGHPHRGMILVNRNLVTVWASSRLAGQTSTHLENRSMQTRLVAIGFVLAAHVGVVEIEFLERERGNGEGPTGYPVPRVRVELLTGNAPMDQMPDLAHHVGVPPLYHRSACIIKRWALVERTGFPSGARYTPLLSFRHPLVIQTLVP